MLNGCSRFLSAKGKKNDSAGLQVYYSKGDKSTGLNRFSGNAGSEALPVFRHGIPFVPGFIDRVTGITEKSAMIKFHTMYSNLNCF